MNRRAIVVALILSLFVSVVLWKKLQSTPRGDAPTMAPPKLETKALVVAKKRIPGRTRLEGPILTEGFEVKEILASEAARFPEAFTNIASLSKKTTAMAYLPGDIITPQRVLDDDYLSGFTQAIPAGKRAYSIQVSKITGVGGFISQGDYVDVIAVFRPRDGVPFTKIVLQDILVLAIGNLYQFDGAVATVAPAIAASKTDLVTFAVTPDEMQRLMFLESGTSGITFKLALKNLKDKDKRVDLPRVTEKMLLHEAGSEPEIAPTVTPIVTPEVRVEPPPLPPAPEVREKPVAEPAPEDGGTVEIRYGSGRKFEIQRDRSSPIESPQAALPTELPAPGKANQAGR